MFTLCKALPDAQYGTHASGQEVFIIQRVARPMKFAAFISIIISVAVLFAACQGPAGVAGDDGADGADGGQGPQGTPGVDALTAKPGATEVIPFNNAVATPETAAVSAVTINMHDYFIGGRTPTFGATGGGPSVALAFDEAGTDLTITITRGQDDAIPNDFTSVTLTAEDEDGRHAEFPLTLRGNDPPTEVTGADLANIRLGLQTDELDMAKTVGTNWTCSSHNSCTASLEPLFEAPAADMTAGDVLTYEATSEDDSKVTVSVEGNMITLTAVATTGVTEGTTFSNDEDQAVGITIKATDAGGFSATREDLFNVLVDSPPTQENQVPHAATYALTETTLAAKTYTLMNAAELARVFKNDGGGTLDLSAPSSDSTVATATADDTNGLQIMALARGPVTITLTATEPDAGDSTYASEGVGQTVTQEITFEVVAP